MFDFDNNTSEICNDDKIINDITNKIFLEKIDCRVLFFNLYNVIITDIDISQKNKIQRVITESGEIINNVYDIIKKIINAHFELKTIRYRPIMNGRTYEAEHIYENDIFYIVHDIYNHFHITLRNDMSPDGLSHALSVYNVKSYQQELLHRYNLIELNKIIENSYYGREY
jgi:hypothetical protein